MYPEQVSKTNAAQTAAERHELGVEWVHIDQVKPWARNTNTHSREQVAKLARVIERHGWTNPIQLDAGGTVVAGHGRLLAAKKLRMSKVPVVRLAVEGAEAEALALGDNWLARMSVDDDAILAKVVEDLNGQIAFDDLDIDLGDLGLDLQALLDDEDPPPAPDEAPAVQEGPPDSVLGGVYELGPHRLVCGDSTEAATWDALLGEEALQGVWTDPPYGVSYVGGAGAEASGGERRGIENDDLDAEALMALLRAALGLALARSAPGAGWYVAGPNNGSAGAVFVQVAYELGVYRHQLIWLKDSMVLGRSDYHYKHEPIFYGWKPGAAHTWEADRKQTTVLEFDRPKRSAEHPTMKPIALVAYCIRNSTKPGWVVGEPFGGSGTTLMACAQEGRVARCIELDPRYCDVIRRRWTRYAVENDIAPGPGALAG